MNCNIEKEVAGCFTEAEKGETMINSVEVPEEIAADEEGYETDLNYKKRRRSEKIEERLKELKKSKRTAL